jgi:hypothetical protein
MPKIFVYTISCSQIGSNPTPETSANAVNAFRPPFPRGCEYRATNYPSPGRGRFAKMLSCKSKSPCSAGSVNGRGEQNCLWM